LSRWIKFLIVIAIGASVGLYYSWVINPTQVENTTPDSLRLDYRSDYVLMVAEIYQLEKDPGSAAERLAPLGPDPAPQVVQQAIIFAEQSGYPALDINLLVQLRDALQTWNPSQ
jgi:hypothetical protein